MKTRTFRFAALLLSILLLASSVVIAQGKSTDNKLNEKPGNNKQKEKPSPKTILFNGKDLKDWVLYLKDSSVDPSTVFTVKDGVINIKGDPFGYIRTKKKYSDYALHVEWRYPSELSNSGVFIHVQEPDTIWPRCIENQLKAGNAGDYVLMNGASIKEQTDQAKRVIPKMAASNEKAAGEWNSIDITCKGNTIETKVNGLLQNKGTGLNVTEGSICLQSEGKTVEFRNVYLTKLKK
ncbi:MAG TPA: DUF1080 domain-containing protein [Bacteroidales bacterium]|nr:DUF1080 domain-containing protein [Bacteroidales bacterium]